MTAEHVMRVLRTNKEPIMAILEAFVYDPLVNWGLVKEQEEAPVSAMGSLFEPSLIDVLTATRPTNVSPDPPFDGLSAHGGHIPPAAVRAPPQVQQHLAPPPAASHGLAGHSGVAPTSASHHPGQSMDGQGENQKALHVLERVESKLSGCTYSLLPPTFIFTRFSSSLLISSFASLSFPPPRPSFLYAS